MSQHQQRHRSQELCVNQDMTLHHKRGKDVQSPIEKPKSFSSYYWAKSYEFFLHFFSLKNQNEGSQDVRNLVNKSSDIIIVLVSSVETSCP